MTPQTQTRTGIHGRCMETSIACIMDIPESEVPDFGDDDVYLNKIATFLEPFGLYYVEVSPGNELINEVFKVGKTYHLINGISPRKGPHAVVGCNGRIVWDPHPQDGTGRGLIRVDCFGLLCNRFDK